MSSSDKVHITISGPTGAGKTTIARIVADALKRAGFSEVVNLDPDARNRGDGLFPVETDRVRRFAEGRRVSVLTANTTRQALQRSETAVKARQADGDSIAGALSNLVNGAEGIAAQMEEVVVNMEKLRPRGAPISRSKKT